MKKIICTVFMVLMAAIMLAGSSYASESSCKNENRCSCKACHSERASEIAANKASVTMCRNCYNYKGGKDHCLKCGQWVSSGNGAMAVMCNSCYTFKGGKDHCIKCGDWVSSNKASAIICKNCYTFKGGKDHCAKCGEWVP